MADAFTPRFVDLVRNIITTTGTGNFTLGSSVSGFNSFADTIKPGETFYYSVIGVDRPTEREVGRGTMMPNGTIKREALAGETLTDFTAGTKTIALVAAAEWFEQIQSRGGSSAGGATTAATRADLSALSPALGAVFLREAERDGLFVYDSANLAGNVAADTAQALHVAPSSDPTGASGAWVRRFTGAFDPRWFGVRTGSDPALRGANRDALVALLRYLKSVGTVNGGLSGTSKVRWSKGEYYFANPVGDHFSVKAAVIFEGDTSGLGGGPSTRLHFEKGGFRVERWDTLNGAADPAPSTGGDGSTFRGLYLVSDQPRPAAGVYAAQATSGILALARVVIEDCWIEDFTADGITLLGGAYSGVNYTNVNCSVIRNTTCLYNGRHGVYLDGGDANACVLDGVRADLNNNWGICDSSFLGNHHSGHHAMFNGASGLGHKTDGLTSIVTHPATSGTMYYVSPGNAAAASTTQPGTNASVWVALAENAGLCAANANAPAWVSGTEYKEGGSYFYDGIGSAVWLNTYSETAQGQPWMGSCGKLEGGTWECNPNSGGQAETLAGGVHTFKKGVQIEGDLVASKGGRTHQFGPRTGAAADQALWFNTTNYAITQKFYRWSNNGLTQEVIGSFAAIYGFGLYLDGKSGVKFRCDGADIAGAVPAGINLAVGKDLQFDGTTVPLRNTGPAKLIGRGSSGAGVAQEITLGAGLTMAGTTLSATSTGGWAETTLAADFVAPNSTAFADITDGTNAMVYTPPPNSNYEIQAAILIETTAATNLPRIGVHVDAQGTGAFGAIQIDQTGATGATRVTSDGTFTTAAVDVQMAAGGVAAANTPYLTYVTVRGRSGAVPAPVRLQLACETAAANTCRVRQGSQMRVKAS